MGSVALVILQIGLLLNAGCRMRDAGMTSLGEALLAPLVRVVRVRNRRQCACNEDVVEWCSDGG